MWGAAGFTKHNDHIYTDSTSILFHTHSVFFSFFIVISVSIKQSRRNIMHNVFIVWQKIFALSILI